MGKYYYKEPYSPTDKNIKYRKCRNCQVIKKNSLMEVSFLCKTCYALVYHKKRCSKCWLLKPLEEYKKTTNSKDGYEYRCKNCKKLTKNTGSKRKKPYKKWKNPKNRVKYHNNKRRIGIKNATLKGFEDQIMKIYEECPEGYSVDHIIPINNDLVCGLNVPWNLQYLTLSENISKSNKLP